MISLRTYGSPPYSVAVVHGGPGACGEMAPVARELSSVCGVLEPIQTEVTIDGQIEELRAVLVEHGSVPVTLIGHSWGCWLSYLVAARYPELVGKLILVGSGPYEQKYVDQIRGNQLVGLSECERAEYESALAALAGSSEDAKAEAYARLGALVCKADTYDALPPDPEADDAIDTEGRSYHEALASAQQMRGDGRLLEYARGISCPVVAIHGDHDTRPAAGVREPLSAIVPDFRMIILSRCGHDPWRERHARDEFYTVLKREAIRV